MTQHSSISYGYLPSTTCGITIHPRRGPCVGGTQVAQSRATTICTHRRHQRGLPNVILHATSLEESECLQGTGTEVVKKRALLDGPPPGYDFRATTSAATRAVVQQEYPQLLPLVDRGVLVLWQRSSGYMERREDGYREPERVFIVATAHVSSQSAADVDQVIQAVRPENVVVELCRSRTAAMADSDPQQEQRQPQQQQQQPLVPSSSGSSSSSIPKLPAATRTRRQAP
uniref:Uncharacterized protein n=2 Tax=Dunaliella tertiolecta TaxID=3047 RepID=A0A7S3QQV0_DUNTE